MVASFILSFILSLARVRIRYCALALLACWGVADRSVPMMNASASEAPERIQYGAPRQLTVLESAVAKESSGMAVSRRRPDVFWTHNDSGNEPQIIAFDTKGKILGTCTIAGASAIDWEDMASFTLDGVPYLLLADIGDSRRQRASHKLYLVEEPMLDQKSVAIKNTIKFSYDDGPHNCEAVAVDTSTKTILLCTKVSGLTCEVFQFELTTRGNPNLVAKPVAKPAISSVTSMDISPDGRRAILLTYGDAYEFVRRDGEAWGAAFLQMPRAIHMPERKQGEAICYGADGKTLYLTSEQAPTPLWEVPVLSPR